MTEPTTPRKSLLRCKWHRSSFVFLVIAVGVVLFLNLPGQILVGPDIFQDGKYGPHFEYYEHAEHGWPFTYLWRETVTLSGPPFWWLSTWNVFEGVRHFSLLYLIADVAIGLIAASAAALLFERWRGRRERLVQFRIRDLLLIVGVLSAIATVLAYHRSQHLAEQNTLRTVESTHIPDVTWGPIAQRVRWQPSGPSWLRVLIGDWPFASFDRVISIDASGINLEQVATLRRLKVVRIMGNVSDRQLQALERLRQLEALDMCFAYVDEADHETDGEDGVESYIRLPHMPKLRGLNLYEAAFNGDGLENIPSIEVLDLSGTDIGDDSIPTLSTLTKLKQLALYDTKFSNEGIERLRRSLPSCNIRW
ncbi:MAG: hypothetical protein KF708_16005 [Pirellulales bacterium]|nr:hypothetical protein [Pirellulales bacterium]